MSQIQRICPQCSGGTPVDARYCPHCGADTERDLAVQQRSLPATVGKAALPVLAGVATFALRTAWRLLNERLTAETMTTSVSEPAQKPAVRPEATPAKRPGHTIRIRSAWAVGDANGRWSQGSSEHTIEFDD
jgi:hypothetical protein